VATIARVIGSIVTEAGLSPAYRRVAAGMMDMRRAGRRLQQTHSTGREHPRPDRRSIAPRGEGAGVAHHGPCGGVTPEDVLDGLRDDS